MVHTSFVESNTSNWAVDANLLLDDFKLAVQHAVVDRCLLLHVCSVCARVSKCARVRAGEDRQTNRHRVRVSHVSMKVIVSTRVRVHALNLIF